MTDFKPGDRVIHTDADDPDAIPAMKVLFGRVEADSSYGIKVEWDCGGVTRGRPGSGLTPSYFAPLTSTYFAPLASMTHTYNIRLLIPEEEAQRVAAHNAMRRDEAIAEVQRRYDAACADNKLLNIRFKE
jgi:hypothetical protein